MSATSATRPTWDIPAGRPTHLRLVTQVPPGPRSLRLTRRGRVVVGILGWSVVVALGVLVVAVAALVLGGPAVAGDRPEAGPPVAEHVVMPGETLWGIASQSSPNEDPRDVVARIVELNALPGVHVRAGQTLFLPAAAAGD